MGRPILLEHCRMADTVKNDPGQWKFIGIEGMLNFFLNLYNIFQYCLIILLTICNIHILYIIVNTSH